MENRTPQPPSPPERGTIDGALFLPRYAHIALEALESEGYESWVVGGYVRDALLNRPSADIDIATAADWRDVKRIFEARGMRTHETGTVHGTLTAIVDEHPLEITTFRASAYAPSARKVVISKGCSSTMAVSVP